MTPPADVLVDDGKKEACGVVGVYAPGHPVAHLLYLGLYALQHRGQESAGMAVSSGDDITVVKDMGLVATVFDDRTLQSLNGHLGIGHTRYSTSGSSSWRNAQPVFRDAPAGQFALGHNGNLVNTEALAAEVGMLPGMVTSDSDLVAEMIQRELPAEGDETSDGRALERALEKVLPQLEGAFSFVLTDESRIIGVRDPNGFRPLCLGRLESGWVLASESPALDVVGAHFVRELDPGEMVVIDATGVRSHEALRRRTGSSRSSASSSSSTSPAPTPVSTARASTPPGCKMGEQLAGPGPGRGRPGHGRARVGPARRRGLLALQRHPLRPGPGQEPLHRAHLHRSEPGDAGPRACA